MLKYEYEYYDMPCSDEEFSLKYNIILICSVLFLIRRCYDDNDDCECIFIYNHNNH